MQANEQRWVWYAGRPSIDFVNTRRDRQAAGIEYLQHPEDLVAWLHAAGLATPHIDVDDTLLNDALELREAIDAAVCATVNGHEFPAPALRQLNSWLAQAPAGPASLRTSHGVAILHSATDPRDARQVLNRIALDAAELLGSDQRARLRICPGPGCGGRFVDDSPARRRRWCSMTVCGNRSKAATHRHRNQAR
jgi:predicted RNA-binding Zn ribbon-like protein